MSNPSSVVINGSQIPLKYSTEFPLNSTVQQSHNAP